MAATTTRRRIATSMLSAFGAVAFVGCGEDRVERTCDVPGQACTWAGIAGEEGFNGDGHDKLDSRLYWTMDLIFAADGTPWFIDWNNHLVRKVLPDDTVQTVVGWIDPVFPGDGVSGNAENSPEGALGTDVQLNHPTNLVELPDGNILIMAWHNHKLRSLDPDTGRVRIVCGAGPGYAGDGGPATLALFKQPSALAVDEALNTYVLDQQNFVVRVIDDTGTITTMAGSGEQGYAGDGGPATEAQFGFEAGSNPEPSGGLTVADGVLYVADTLNNRIRAVDLTTGVVNTVAGSGEQGYAGDGGPALDAELNSPRDLEFGPDGHLYVADTDNAVIRAIDLADGTIRTVAGTGELGLDADDDRPATETRLRRPFGIAFDAAGHLYIADTINSRIVRVAK